MVKKRENTCLSMSSLDRTVKAFEAASANPLDADALLPHLRKGAPRSFPVMKRLSPIAAFCLGSLLLCAPVFAAEAIAPKTPSLDGLFIITEQSPTLDWWTKVPTNTGAQISPVKKVYRGQTFSLVPFVMGYTLDDDNAFNVSYSLTKESPDQKRVQLLKDFPIRGPDKTSEE